MDEKRFAAIHFTFHAVQQMAHRHISADAAEYVLQHGQLRPGREDSIIAEHVGDDGKLTRVVYTELREGEIRIARVITAIRIGKR